MIVTDKEYGQFDISLSDDGTLDTVITVDPLNDYGIDKAGAQDIRFSTEYVVECRDETGAMTDEGFQELAAEALEAYIEQYLID